MTPEEALARIPGCPPGSSLRELPGGLTNRTWRVGCGGRDLVLRLDADFTRTFGLDRKTELTILRHAEAKKLAPRVVFADPDAGILMYEYLPGVTWERASLDEPRNLRRLAALLRKVHALPLSGRELDSGAAARRYAATASQDPDLRASAAEYERLVAAIPAPVLRTCCHNDVVAANIIDSAGLRLLDWEYACDNDPFFDLASLVAYHDLGGSRQCRVLLDNYTDGAGPESVERLQEQIRLFDALQWLWIAARHVLAPDERHRARLAALRDRIR